MKKHPGRIRYIQFEGDGYMSCDDVKDQIETLPDSLATKWILAWIKDVMLSCSNLVPGMADDKKQEWDKIMKPN